MNEVNRLAALTGWRRRGAAMALGAVAALALPPVGFFPVLWLCIPGLVYLLDGSADRRSAFGAGFWYGMGWFAAGLYWISYALLTDAARFGWMIPFAVFGLSAVLAAFLGAATLLARLACPAGPWRVVALAAAWTLMEWARSWAFTGFPWNPLGSVWDRVPAVLQFGAVGGVFGLTLITLPAFAAPVLLAARRGRMLAAVAMAPVVLAGLGGAVRLAGAPDLADAAAYVPKVVLRLVQADVAQGNKWRDDLREAHLREHVELSRRPGFEDVTTVVWPETAASYFLDLDPVHRMVAALAAPARGLLLTGAPRITPRGVEPLQIWNSLMAIDADGRVAGIYDKVHLVPFGEYVPLKEILPIAKITHGGTDFSAGPGARTLDLPGLPPVAPMICYEAIFPGAVVGADQPRPSWLLNITNDGWFGLSAGPYQHLAAARMRAIEEGLPLVRAANTGVSAVIDRWGRTVASLGLGEKGIVDSRLPLADGPTLYSRSGNLPAVLIVAAILAACAAYRRLHNSKR
ncbi:MAG: apolipoprotein N-acyltransferase [Actinomycetota bacterium]